MSKSTLRVVARLVSQAGKVEEFKAILSTLREPTRKEAGCISYELTQNNADPTDFTFIEEWASQEALDAHMKTAHIADALGKATPLFGAPPDIRVFTTIW
jgi:quinol monooxygenase YgiN